MKAENSTFAASAAVVLGMALLACAAPGASESVPRDGFKEY